MRNTTYTLKDVWVDIFDALRIKNETVVLPLCVKSIDHNVSKNDDIQYDIIWRKNISNQNRVNIMLHIRDNDLWKELCTNADKTGELLKSKGCGSNRGTLFSLKKYLNELHHYIYIYGGLDGVLEEDAGRYQQIMERSVTAAQLCKHKKERRDSDTSEEELKKFPPLQENIDMLEVELCKYIKAFTVKFSAKQALKLIDIDEINHDNMWKCLAAIVFYAVLETGKHCKDEYDTLMCIINEYVKAKAIKGDMTEKPKDITSLSADTIHLLDYHNMMDLGYDSLSICQKLVDNDNLLYKLGTGHKNEGTPELWAKFLEANPDNFLFAVKGKEIIGNYSFVVISDEQVVALKRGELYEADFTIAKNSVIFASGMYTLYLLNFSFNQGYNYLENYDNLWNGFIRQIIKYAIQNKVYFRRIYVNAFREDHEEIYKQLGFQMITRNKSAGIVYGLERFPDELEWRYKEKLVELYNEMHDYVSSRIEYRQLTEQDIKKRGILFDAAKLIYDTDPFIYPAMFHTSKDAVKVLTEVIKSGKDTMFSVKNIFAAMDGEKIVGIILWCKGGLIWDEQLIKSVADSLNIDLCDTLDKVSKEYFGEYNRVELGNIVSLINVCIAEKYRSLGIGRSIFQEFMKKIPHEGSYELFCLEENKAAIRLYKKAGFHIVSRQKAFTVSNDNVYAVKMVKDKNK